MRALRTASLVIIAITSACGSGGSSSSPDSTSTTAQDTRVAETATFETSSDSVALDSAAIDSASPTDANSSADSMLDTLATSESATPDAADTGATTDAIATGDSDGSCGTMTTSPCSVSGTTCSLDVNGTTRTFYVQLPTTYDASTPHPLIFQFHWLGGTAEEALTFYQLNSRIPNAIFVTPQGLLADDAGDDGWPNTGGQDVNFTKAMLQYVESNYCVDKSRIFSTGFSYGAMMSITLGCQMSDVFRAIAPESGFSISYPCSPTHPIAVWQSQGNTDTTVTPANAQTANNIFVTLNGCTTTTQAVSPSPCVEYQGCQTGYPVTWCLFNGGHEPFNNTDSGFGSTAGPDAIAAFFNQF